jgi:hypothetical protein
MGLRALFPPALDKDGWTMVGLPGTATLRPPLRKYAQAYHTEPYNTAMDYAIFFGKADTAAR